MCAEAQGRAALEAAFHRLEAAVIDFVRTPGDASQGEVPPAEGTWTRGDVVGHLTGWLEFSGRKLRSMAAGLAFDDVADLEAFNEGLYQRFRGRDLATLCDAFQSALADYCEVLHLFSEEDLSKTEFPTGFGFALWKYLLMDGVVHPVQHLLYQSLKEGDLVGYEALKREFHPEVAAFTPNLEAFELREFPPIRREVS